MKRLIVALLVGGAVFGAVYGVAATLLVSGGTLQMSTAVDAECDGDGVALGYLFFDSDADPSTDNDIVTEAQVRNIDDACTGDVVTVELFDGSKCDEAEVEIPADGAAGDEDADAGEVGVNLNLDDDGDGEDDGDTCYVLEVQTSFVNIASPADWP